MAMSDTTFDRNILGSEAAKLLEVLLERADEAGRAQMPTTTLLKASGLTQGALVRARNALTQHGLLRTEPGFSTNGLRGANVYALNLVALGPTSTPVHEGESDQNRASEPQSAASPASSRLREASSEGQSPRKGFLARLLRRS